jgi:hypothetical protein
MELFSGGRSTDSNSVRGVVIILDTLKKFADLMEKKSSSRFTEIIRAFIMKGGTVIALAHTNKKPGRDGKPVHAGTTDIRDDFDCGYILDTLSKDGNTKVVEFTNIKSRGNVSQSVSCRYSLEKGFSYDELLASVKEVDPNQLMTIKNEVEAVSDAAVIVAIESCIKNGINTKMKLAEAVAERAKVSQKTAIKIIEKYSGNDPGSHKWHFVVRQRGAKVYELLNRPAGNPPDPAIPKP